jgi:hypothetical protein
VDRDRVVAANAADVWIPRLVSRARRGERFAERELQTLLPLVDIHRVKVRGLTPFERDLAARNYVHLTEHLLTPKDIPHWMTVHPATRLLSQYHHWDAAQGRVLGRTLVNTAREREAKRLVRNALVAGGVMPVGGLIASEAIQTMKGKKGPKLFRQAVRNALRGQATRREREIILAHLIAGAEISPGLGLAAPLPVTLQGMLGMVGTEGEPLSVSQVSDELGMGPAVLSLIAETAPRVGEMVVHALRRKPVRRDAQGLLRKIGLVRDTQGLRDAVGQNDR